MLTEIYVLRDAIAHGHLWEVSYDLDDNWDQHVKQAIRDSIDDNMRMRSARRASVRSAGCEALRAEQTVDTPHPHVVAGREAFGNNKKFDAAVDLSTRQTRKLGLNVLPSLVNRTDVAKVLDIIFEALRFLQKEVDEDWQTDKMTVGFRGQRMELIKCVDTIKADCFA